MTIYIVRRMSGNSHVVMVDGDNEYCSCPSFFFRRKCRHIDVVKEIEASGKDRGMVDGYEVRKVMQDGEFSK